MYFFIVVFSAQAERELASYLETKNISHLFEDGSVQREFARVCRSTMAVQPLKTQALLFYSQTPLGDLDKLSVHGGCPVLKGTKWAANL